MSSAPNFKLHIVHNTPPGIPHFYMDQPGPGDVFTTFELSSPQLRFSEGIDAKDSSFKITNIPVLTNGGGSRQGDGVTMMRTSAAGIVDFHNQSRARAYLNHPQLVPASVWTPIEFDVDGPLPAAYDQQSEFKVWPSAASFSPTHEGFYQVNARTEFEYGTPESPIPNGYVSIAIFVNGVQYAEGNNLQMVTSTSLVLWTNNAPNVSDVIYLLPGDVVQIMAWQSVEGFGLMNLVPGASETFVSIHKSS